MNTVSLLNQKGGTGKTTSSVSLAEVWSRDHDVLAVDMDPQASLSAWIGETGPHCFEYLRGNRDLTDALSVTDWDVDLLPANRSLGNIEGKENRKPVFQQLQKLISAAESAYDFCLIDPPPSTGFLVLMAIRASDSVVSPIQPGQSAITSFGQTMQLVEKQNPDAMEGGFLCQMDMRTRIDQDAPDLLKDAFGNQILDTFIRRTVSVREAEAAGEPPTAYDPESTAAEDYQSLAQEVQTRL